MRSLAALTLFIVALALSACAPRSVATADKSPAPFASAEPVPANVPDSFRRGEKLFRKYGCRACHGFGEFFGKCPDLAGVTVRDSPQWIRDWLSDPEKMRQTDQYARDLSARFETVMPNLGLKASEIDDLLVYLKAEGSAAQAVQP